MSGNPGSTRREGSQVKVPAYQTVARNARRRFQQGQVCGDAVQRGADLNHEPVAEALLARFVVVLRAFDVRFCERSDANRAAQGAG